jgi:hypothetical protein
MSHLGLTRVNKGVANLQHRGVGTPKPRRHVVRDPLPPREAYKSIRTVIRFHYHTHEE